MTCRLKYFHAVVSSVACFGACHRTMHPKHLQQMAIDFRKLARQVVGAPSGTDWSRPWHEILHDWDIKLRRHMMTTQIQSWDRCCASAYWRMAAWIATLPSSRWVRRALAWQPNPQPTSSRRRGRPRKMWDSLLIALCRCRGLVDWLAVASDALLWSSLEPGFIEFCCSH
jgi:hypothetical protein